MPTMKARYGDSGLATFRSLAQLPPISAGISTLCPRLDTGKSSVTPWIRPTTAASRYVRCDMQTFPPADPEAGPRLLDLVREPGRGWSKFRLRSGSPAGRGAALRWRPAPGIQGADRLVGVVVALTLSGIRPL